VISPPARVRDNRICPRNRFAIAGDGEIVYRQACQLGCEGIVSKRLGSLYRSGRSKHWVKVKNPAAPAELRKEVYAEWTLPTNVS
jgi:ATP-dependent DNA ligase